MTETPTIPRISDFAKKELGLTLTPGQLEMLEGFEAGGFSEAAWACGRRGGKSTLADVIVTYDALVRNHLRSHLLPGEPRISGIVAQNLERARRHITRCAAWIRANPTLAGLLVSETADELTFKNGSVIAAYPCSARSLRGDAWSSCVLDELAHYVDTTDGNASGERVYEAVGPSLAQFAEDGWLVAISTPRWRQGQFWKLVQRAQGGQFKRMHFAHKSSIEMNPRLSIDWLAEKEREDADSYRREYLAEFSDRGAFLDSLDVLACVRRGEGVLPPAEGIHYRAAIDPAFERDFFALGIAHKENDALVVDGVWTWRAGFDTTLDQVSAVAHDYRIRDVLTDQFSAAAVVDGLKRRGLSAVVRPWANAGKYNAFIRLKAALSTRTIELPDDEALISELLNLEATPTPSGLTRIAAAGSGHDDRAFVLAALAQELIGRRPSTVVGTPLLPMVSIQSVMDGTATSDSLLAGMQSTEQNATRWPVASPDPAVRVPEGSACTKPGCGASAWNTNGRCIRCDTPAPGISSGGGAPVPWFGSKQW